MTITDFAIVAKLPVSTIWRHATGRFKPSPANALRIQQATNGAVTVMDLLFPGKEEQ